jgi:Rieske Fe-S protein
MKNIPPDDFSNRRKFLCNSGRLLVMISSFGALACACVSEQDGERRLSELVFEDGKIVLDLGKNHYRALNTVGSGLKIEMSRQEKPLIITRVTETRVAAFSSQCTHAGYEVLLPEQGILVCGSGHGGSFDLEGRVLSPPPTSNLQSYPTQLIANRVYVTYPLG